MHVGLSFFSIASFLSRRRAAVSLNESAAMNRREALMWISKSSASRGRSTVPDLGAWLRTSDAIVTLLGSRTVNPGVNRDR